METIKVRYPGGGRKFLLNWYSFDEQSNIVLADSKSAMFQTAKIAYQQYKFDKVQDCFELEIVAPSVKLCNTVIELKKKEAVNNFLRESHFEIQRCFLERKKPLPALFKQCEKYDPDFELTKDDTWLVDVHYNCKNCVEKISLVGISKETFVDRYYNKWYELHPNQYHQYKNYVKSRARVADDAEEIYYASASDFGDHGKGLTLQKVSKDFDCETALFFFKRLNDIDTAEFNLYIEAEKKRFKELRAALKKKYEQERSDKVNEEEKRLMELFS